MTAITVVWEGVAQLREALVAMTEEIDGAVRSAVALSAHATQAAAMGDAPVVSGTLRRSIKVEGPERAGIGWSARVGPTVKYGRRVELGFEGADSLGRQYNQSGNPYMQPAYESVVESFDAILVGELRKVVR